MVYLCRELKTKIMTQLVLNVRDQRIIPHLRKVLNSIDGVSVAKMPRKKKCGMEEALEDARKGRVSEYASVDDFFKKMGL